MMAPVHKSRNRDQEAPGLSPKVGGLMRGRVGGSIPSSGLSARHSAAAQTGVDFCFKPLSSWFCEIATC